MEYYEGNRTRNWKEKQEQDGNERNGYWAKSHENADAIKRFLFLFYFFSLLGLMISTAIIIKIPTTFEGKCVRVWMQEKEMEACDWWRKSLKYGGRSSMSHRPFLHLIVICLLADCSLKSPIQHHCRGAGAFLLLCAHVHVPLTSGIDTSVNIILLNYSFYPSLLCLICWLDWMDMKFLFFTKVFNSQIQKTRGVRFNTW